MLPNIPNGLTSMIEELVHTINFSYDISLPVDQDSTTSWLNNIIVDYWKLIAREHEQVALDYLIKYIVEKEGIKLNVLFNILHIMIDEKIYCRKRIATVLVGSDSLKLTNKDFFRRCYNFLNNQLQSLDYKTNREVFNKSIEKTHNFPDLNTIKEKRHIYFCLQVIKRLMNRENNYMPAYFAMHELMKCYSPNDKSDIHPHKLLEADILQFMNSFRKPAKLLIPFCRNYFIPIAGITHPSNGTFRLDANKKLMYISVNRGAVLYSDNICCSQIDECIKLLIQTRSMDLAFSLYEISRGGAKSAGLESAFANLIYEVMTMIENLDNPVLHHKWIMGLIEHLVCCVLYFLHLMMVGFAGIFTELNNKIINKSWKKCRNYICWFVVNTTSGFINKNMLEDFVPCLKLFDSLFPMSETLWIDDIRKALSHFEESQTLFDSLIDDPPTELDEPIVIKNNNENSSSDILDIQTHFLHTAPLVLWIHLVSKSHQSTSSPLPRQIPPPLQPLNQLITSEINRLTTAAATNTSLDSPLPLPDSTSWYTLILVLNTFSTNNETTSIIGRLIESLWGVRTPAQTTHACSIQNNVSTNDLLPIFKLPYGLTGRGQSTLLSYISISVMSIHVKFLLYQLLTYSLFSEIHNINMISPQVVESFCRLLLHREIDGQHLSKFIEPVFLQRGIKLLQYLCYMLQAHESVAGGAGTGGPQSITGPTNPQDIIALSQDIKLFYIMLDILINRLSHYLIPEAVVTLTSIISTRFSIVGTIQDMHHQQQQQQQQNQQHYIIPIQINHSINHLIPIQIQDFLDHSILHLTRLFQKPDITLYGLGCLSSGKSFHQKSAMNPSIGLGNLHGQMYGHVPGQSTGSASNSPGSCIARFVSDCEEYNKAVLISLIQIYKAYEMEEVTHWTIMLQETIRQMQIRQQIVTPNTPISQQTQQTQQAQMKPIRLNQLQGKEITEGLQKIFGNTVLITGSSNSYQDDHGDSADISDINSGQNSNEYICQTGFGTFRFPVNSVRSCEEFVKKIDKDIYHIDLIGLLNLSHLTQHQHQIASSPKYYCLLLKIILQHQSQQPPSSPFTIAPSLSAILNLHSQLSRRVQDQALRNLCNYTFSHLLLALIQQTQQQQQQPQQFTQQYYTIDILVDALEWLCLKLHIIPLDRLLIFLLSSSLPGVSSTTLQTDSARLLFLLINDLLERCVPLSHSLQLLLESTNNIVGNPCHLDDWHNIHMMLHDKMPECFSNCNNNSNNSNNDNNDNNNSNNTNNNLLPHYYNHLLLRLIPVFELVITMLVHVPQAVSSRNHFFDMVSKLFRFHSYPLYFCFVLIRSQSHWSTDNRRLLRKLVYHILQEHQSSSAYFTSFGWNLLSRSLKTEAEQDRSCVELCQGVMHRVYQVSSTGGREGITNTCSNNWRTDESTSVLTKTLYGGAIELMLCYCGNPSKVVESLINICYQQQNNEEKFQIYMNSFGSLMALLSKDYRIQVCKHLCQIVNNKFVKSQKFVDLLFDEVLPNTWDPCKQIQNNTNGDSQNPSVDLQEAELSQIKHIQLYLCLWHSLWTHSNLTQITYATSYFREFIRPFVECEGQFLLACHMIGPLMWPLQTDKTGKLIELVVELYNSLAQLPNSQRLQHDDVVADIMYHIKYIYVGHGVLEYVRDLFSQFQDDLREKLKFILPQSNIY